MVLVPNFFLKQTTSNLGTKFAQKGLFVVKNKKSEHQNWILHIWMSLGTKF